MTKMSEKLAIETLSDEQDVHNLSLDPMTILLVTSVIIELVKLYQSCKKEPEEAVLISQNSGVIENGIVKKNLRKQMGTVKYLTQGGPRLANQIIKRATRISTEEMSALYTEAEEN